MTIVSDGGPRWGTLRAQAPRGLRGLGGATACQNISHGPPSSEAQGWVVPTSQAKRSQEPWGRSVAQTSGWRFTSRAVSEGSDGSIRLFFVPSIPALIYVDL